jgi:hypothetical protein
MRTVGRWLRKASWRVSAILTAMAVVAAFAAAGVPATSANSSPVLFRVAATGGCATPSDELIEYVDSLVAGSDSILSIEQRQWANLPPFPAESVTVVTDSAICHRALVATGLSRIVPDSTVVRGVSILRVGPTRYVVTDTGSYTGEFQMHLTFDSAFTVPPLAVWGH